MRLHQPEFETKKDRVEAIAEKLAIRLHIIDLRAEFEEKVLNYFTDLYFRGLTPNPCVVCNRQIKFGAMIDFADSLGIEKVATGHYLRCDGRYIYTAKDGNKDQSYFLALVRREVLPRLIFPLGEMLKEEVKGLAAEIPVLREIALQKESSEICFVENDYTEILQKHMEIDREGEVVDETGRVVGTNKGYMHYTVGKRRGFTVRGAHEPHYVLSLDAERNRLVVGTRERLLERSFGIHSVNLFEEGERFRCRIKVRYRTRAVPGEVTLQGDRGFVELDEAVSGLARGQFAVFYDGDRLLGGGVIA